MRRFIKLLILFCLVIALSIFKPTWADEKASRGAVEEDRKMIDREFAIMIHSLGMGDVATHFRAAEGATLLIDCAFVFDSGSVDLKPEIFPLLEALVPIINNPDWRYPIAVEGHTDNIPPSEEVSTRWPTNWEFSAARAARIVRFLEQSGVPGGRLRAVGFADKRPFGTSMSDWIKGCSEELIAYGNQKPFLRSANRRIIIRFEVVWHLSSL